MTANEILNSLINMSQTKCKDTVDTIKAGSGDKTVNRVAVCFIATPNLIKAAAEWGADLIITHEPTYYDNFDNMPDCAVAKEKKQLLEETGMTVFRFHDHVHAALPDIIIQGFVNKLGLPGDYDGKRRLVLDTPITPSRVAALIKEKCGVAHVRVAGAADTPMTILELNLGAPGERPYISQRDGDVELSICGEICEWKYAEYIRDAAELGHKKALIVFGHVGTERDGMVYLSSIIKQKFPSLEIKYFECGEALK